MRRTTARASCPPCARQPCTFASQVLLAGRRDRDTGEFDSRNVFRAICELHEEGRYEGFAALEDRPSGPGPNDGRSTPTGNCTDVSADKVIPYEPMADQQLPAARTLGPMASLPTGVLAHLLASRRENRADTQASLAETRPRPAGPRPKNRTRTATVRARFDAQDSGLGPQDVKVRIVDATIRGPPRPKTQRSRTQTRSSQVRSELQRGDHGT